MSWIVTSFAAALVGSLLGWLIGASQSPVVAGVLPLICGIFGTRLLAMFERERKQAATSTRLGELTELQDLQEVQRTALINAVADTESDTSISLQCHGAAIVLFSLGCFAGLYFGGSTRDPALPDLAVILSESAIQDVEPSALPVLQSSLQDMHFSGLSHTEIKAVFVSVYKPLLDDSSPAAQGEGRPDPLQPSLRQKSNSVQRLEEAVQKINRSLPQDGSYTVPVSAYPV